MIKISVIVTAYQYRPYIWDALNSVINQDLERDKYEVILVSNFKNAELEEYCKRERIKLILSKNRWIGPKVKEALKQSSGDLIALLEDDDLFMPNKLSKVLSVFENDRKLGFYRHKMMIINEEGKPSKFGINNLNKIYLDKEKVKLSQAYLIMFRNREGYAAVSSMIMRKNILLHRIEYLNKIRIATDSFYIISSLLSKYNIYLDNEILGKYRFQKVSASSRFTNFNEFVNYYTEKYKYQCLDMLAIYNLTKGTDLERFLYYDYIFLKVLHKLFSSNNECNLSIRDVFRLLYNPYGEKSLMNFVLGVASFLPLSVKRIIQRRIFNDRMLLYKKLFE
ncbi:glycosyltransferase family 2 protein [Saccharolobus islandicus]|uniref:Glycosyl transferase, family 2 n=1 Tax=Saccharolobus islandicus (strain L.D.8.5 / Lassen \|nr:glycosyltransferase family 2 protein [Sulfolobus islandicus]ADB86818.1 glycosyl transferase, family 2 [Sulfolobus islandicus L.D.8.5]